MISTWIIFLTAVSFLYCTLKGHLLQTLVGMILSSSPIFVASRNPSKQKPFGLIVMMANPLKHGLTGFELLLNYKSLASPAPPGSGLQGDVYFLAVQTEAQRKVFERLRSNLVCIDETHNTTMYEKLILTTLLVRDEWGHGFPVAWLLASSGTQVTLRVHYFLYLVRKRNPMVILGRIMTDRYLAQINPCSSCYPEAAILLCWWHVLHAWQQHFHISDYPELWTTLKGWLRITDQQAFDVTWEKIKLLASPSFLTYLQTHWMTPVFLRMWSAVYRQGRNINEMSDTNMLIEAYVLAFT
jgi:hypothetical protein